MFVHFGIKDVIDILLVALLLYNIYKMMKDSGTINIFGGIMAFLAVWIVVTRILDMRLMGAIMDKLISVGVLILVILFQDDGVFSFDYFSQIKKIILKLRVILYLWCMPV